MKGFSPPIRFVICVVALWVGFRLATFTEIHPQHWGTDRASSPTERLAASTTAEVTPKAAVRSAIEPSGAARANRPRNLLLSARFARTLTYRPEAPSARRHPTLPYPRDTATTARRPAGIAASMLEADWLAPSLPPESSPIDGRPDIGSAPASRWSLAGWSLWRPGSGPPSLASGGQLGGSQAGLRLGYRLVGDAGRNLALNFRLSRPIDGPDGAEAAVGIAIRPVENLPVEILAERRIAIEDGGRDAWALGVAGGIDGVTLPLDLELGGWAQAGIVGARSRDLYAEGAMAVRRPVLDAGRATLSVGAAGWAAAQPGAARLDVGPEASLSFPVGDGAMRLGASWRQRIAGDAAPGSGPALTLGTDF